MDRSLAASKIEDGGSHFAVPRQEDQSRISKMTKDEWMAEYGSILSSERHFLKKDPDWARNPKSWWYKVTGRDGEEPPLWMQEEWHFPELDMGLKGSRTDGASVDGTVEESAPGGDRHTVPVDLREEKPLWAERMYASHSGYSEEAQKMGQQSTTIYGHRHEYRPSSKSGARSMYDRYQPSYQRLVNEEIPDTAAPPDGRFWKAGVAQGVTTNPYEKRLSLSGHRKPIVIGPNSISIVVDGEGHTLANVLRDVAWTHPDTEFAGYTLEHPVYRHMNFRVQTKKGASKSSEHVLSDILYRTQGIMHELGASMESAMAQYGDSS